MKYLPKPKFFLPGDKVKIVRGSNPSDKIYTVETWDNDHVMSRDPEEYYDITGWTKEEIAEETFVPDGKDYKNWKYALDGIAWIYWEQMELVKEGWMRKMLK